MILERAGGQNLYGMWNRGSLTLLRKTVDVDPEVCTGGARMIVDDAALFSATQDP